MEKEFKATQKYLLMSPRKIRLVAGVIKKMKPVEAVEKLPFIQKRAGVELSKVIKAAVAAAKNAGVGEGDLVFKEIQIGEGPRLKRGKAASRGMWHPFKRRMAHIRIILMTNKKALPSDGKQMTNDKLQTNEKSEKQLQKKEEVKNGTKS